MVYLQARGLDFFQRLRFGRPLSMHACMLRSELFRAFRDATIRSTVILPSQADGLPRAVF
jgi:hypothetical protein